MSKILNRQRLRLLAAMCVLLAAALATAAAGASAGTAPELMYAGQAVAPGTVLEASWLVGFEGAGCEAEGSLTLASKGSKDIASGTLPTPICESGKGVTVSGQITSVEIKAGGKAAAKLSAPLTLTLESGPCVYEVKKVSGSLEGDDATIYSESVAKLNKTKSSKTKYACAKTSIDFEYVSLFLEAEELEVKGG